MRELEILVMFGASTNADINSNWCDDIEVFIDYDANDSLDLLDSAPSRIPLL